MKTLLQNQISELHLKLIKELKNFKQVYLTEKDLEEWNDNIYEAPRIYDIDKYGYHNEYSIISINQGIIKTQCISEGYDGEKTFNIENLTIDELLQI